MTSCWVLASCWFGLKDMDVENPSGTGRPLAMGSWFGALAWKSIFFYLICSGTAPAAAKSIR